MKLTREKGLRMWGGGGTGGSVGGGGLDPSALAGYATMGWVEDSYVSKAFFNQLFEYQYNHRVLTKDGETVVSDVTTAMVAAPNEVVDLVSHTETDEETGYTIITTNTITGIKAKAGLWTNQYLSALGQNAGGGGGGGATLFEPLLSINESGLAAPTDAQDGMTVVWDKTTHKWKYGATGGGSGEYLPLTIPNAGSTVNMPGVGKLTFKNTASDYPMIRFEGNTGGGLGFLGIGKTGDDISPYFLTAVNGNYVEGQSQWYKLWHDGSHPTTLNGYGITDAVGNNVTWWGRTISDGVVTGSLTSVADITMSGYIHIGEGYLRWSQDVSYAGGRNVLDIYSWDSSNSVYRDILIGTYIDAIQYGGLYYRGEKWAWGIGTDDPKTKLDVNGGVKATKFYLYKPNANNDTGAVYFQYVSGQSGVQLVGAGFFTGSYVSALGANSAGGGGGATLFEPLLSINESGIAAPTDAQDGMTVVWDKNTHKWKYGATGGGSGEYLPLTIPNAGSTVNMPGVGKLTFKNTASDYPMIRFEGNTGGGLGFLGIGKTGDDISPYFLTAVNGNYVEGQSQWYKLWHDGSHPTTIQGYGITDAVKNNATWWGQSITNGVVSGNMTGVGGISMTGNISMTGTYDLTLSNNGVTSIAYPGYRLLDANWNIVSQYIGIVNPNGYNGFWIGARNYDTEGTMVADKGIGLSINKNGEGYWTVHEPASFRTAIGINLDNLVTTNTDQTITGTKTFTSNIILANSRALMIKDAGGTACNVVSLNSNNNFVLGWAVRNVSDTYLCGKTLSLYVHDANNINTTRNVLYANNAGNVGIGTVNPVAKLDVNGHLKATTFLAHHNGVGTNGTAGWICLANIKLESAYASQPLKFRVTQRGRFGGEITLRFTNVSAAADADIQEFSYTGNIAAAKIVKSGANFSLYVQKSEAYDNIGISLVDLGSYITNKVTVTWSDTLLTTDPGGTAAACRYYFSPTAYLEYDATNGAVHVVGAGLYSDSYVSALGANSSGGGGGGGASSLSELLDVTISSPSGGQVLTYSNGQWINAAIPTPSMTGYAKETWVESNFASLTWIGQQGYLTSSSLNGYATQTWVNQQGFITSSSISDMATKTWVQNQGYLTASSLSGYATQSWVNNQISDMATKTWVGQQGFLTSSAISDMATKTWVANNFLGINATAVAATKLATPRELWGQSFDGTAAVTGTLSYVGDINSNALGSINNFNKIELNAAANAGNGGAIYFHYNGISGRASSYIINDADGLVSVLTPTGNIGLKVGTQTNDYIQIGDIRIVYDNTDNRNSLKVVKSDGTAANLYATGGVSALGMSAGVSSIDAMTFGYLKVNDQLAFGNNQALMYKDDYLYIECSDTISVNTVEFDYGGNVYTKGDVRAARFYLDSNRYLYVSGGTLYYYNGSTSKQVAFTN